MVLSRKGYGRRRRELSIHHKIFCRSHEFLNLIAPMSDNDPFYLSPSNVNPAPLGSYSEGSTRALAEHDSASPAKAKQRLHCTK